MKLWGGRFERGPSEIFERFSNSLGFDRRLLEADIQGSQAFARALERAGILSPSEREAIVAAFEQIRQESRQPSFWEGAQDEDVHTLVIRKLKEKTGPLADKIHTGRSRNEQVSLDTRLWLRDAIGRIQGKLADLMAELVALARRYPDAVLPGFTHLRRAQAVLWPHYLLAYFEMFRRDWDRLGAARRAANVLPLGSGALAGSGFPFDRDELARDLGFEAVTANSMDVAADRDFVLDFLHAASMTTLHLSRLAEDWILYSSEEFGWLELGDEVTSGSSLMPQKKNPDAMELVRGKAGRLIGNLVSLMVVLKGLPMSYNKDLQEDKAPLFDSLDALTLALPVVAGAVRTLKVNAERMRAALDPGMLATDVAEYLVRKGVPFRQAHHLTGQAVARAEARGVSLDALPLEDWRAISSHFDADVRHAFDFQRSLAARDAIGGTAPRAVRAQIRQAERWLKRRDAQQCSADQF